MQGLSPKVLKSLESTLKSKFDGISLRFIGLIPRKVNEKHIVFQTSKDNLISIFLQALGSKNPNKLEEATLKTMLSVANNYLNGLRDRTVARLVSDVDSYIKNKKRKGNSVSVNEIDKIIKEQMDKAGNHLKLIVNAESNKATNVGTALQIAKIAEERKEEDPTVFFVVTIDDVTGPEEFVLHLLPDRITPRVWKLSEIGHGYHKVGEPNPKFPGLHPNCFVGNSGVQVLTEKDGYKNIKNVVVGDRVLTHTGKFKRVTNTLEWYNNKYYGQFIEIKFNGAYRDGLKTHTLKVTPEHEFLTQRGWVQAQNLKKTDKFKQLFTNCSSCGKKTYVKPKRKGKDKLEGYFCNNKCSSNFLWSHDTYRKNISHKNSIFMEEKWQNPTEDMYDGVRSMNKIHKRKIKEGKFWAQQKENLSTMQKNIAKINQKLQKDKLSKEELRLFNLVKSIYPTATSQSILEKWCVDIFIPELGVNIEYDGGDHYLPVYTGKYSMEYFLSKQEGRDSYLEKCGYHILRYDHIPNTNKIKEDIERVSKNHTSEYYFDDVSIKSIKKVKNGNCGYKLYDLTVEDDESFVVNGVISHNCRCKLTYLAPGWGFDASGRIKYKGPKWDEFKHQREIYGLPR